jgi:hypothetical protein
MHRREPIGAGAGHAALRPADAIAMVVAACSVFEPPLAGVPGVSAGTSGPTTDLGTDAQKAGASKNGLRVDVRGAPGRMGIGFGGSF